MRTNAECQAVSGTWSSLYDGATWAQCDVLGIDHMVPLAQAWRSGANTWTTARRRAFDPAEKTALQIMLATC
ncbi:hypothetical protein AB0H37_41415 [Actinomadura sp. NPDC023710]|uniref:hypothetical protein n=1 Tax=Actinomadura sp. NPDC023710 TaxID=3158219 RepID=UPI0033C6636E